MKKIFTIIWATYNIDIPTVTLLYELVYTLLFLHLHQKNPTLRKRKKRLN
jgi:hypothetical protein